MDDEATNDVWPHLLQGGLNLFLTNLAYNPHHLASGEMTVKALRARLNSSPGHTWPTGRSLPTFGLYCFLLCKILVHLFILSHSFIMAPKNVP